MRRIGFALLGALALGSVLAAATTVMADNDGRGHEGRTILEFDTMTPVVPPFLNNQGHPIRGVNGGGVPWAIKRGEGELKANGKLEVRVEGLVIPGPPNNGRNPAAQFIAAVNCLTTTSPDNGVTLLTAPVNVGPEGNARFEATLDLPHPCVAPIVFVGTPIVVNGQPVSLRWFATTGN
jgi:hypothetical protein